MYEKPDCVVLCLTVGILFLSAAFLPSVTFQKPHVCDNWNFHTESNSDTQEKR